MQPQPETSELEKLLVSAGLVTEEQVARARRMSSHLRKPMRPGEILVETGHIARAEYERVVRMHRSMLTIAGILREQSSLDDEGLRRFDELRAEFPERDDRALLVTAGLVTEEQFLQGLAIKHDITYVVPDPGLVDTMLLDKVSLPFLQRHRLLPLRMADGVLIAAMADPLDPDALAELERAYKVKVKPCAATEANVLETLKTLAQLKSGRGQGEEQRVQYFEASAGEEESSTNAEGAVATLDYLLMRAVQMRASDVHVEPFEGRVRVRVRVDGVLQNLTDLPVAFGPQVTSRIKVLADCDIAERRLHQDGRFFVKVDGREVDVRVSSYASVFGETVVLRLLDRQRGLLALEHLGLEPRTLQGLRETALRTSSGLLLVVGPTSSGKTTTLYSFVDFVNEPSVKTISCEDPVEYVLQGVTQCSVNSKSGPTFADSLRAIVRQDPDIIVVGEIRDQITAGMAVEAALTGHKVFSTFHADDTVGATVRLNDMGIEPFLVASTLCGIVAQRLVRRVCPVCRRPVTVSREDLRFLGLERSDLEGVTFVEGEGCTACQGTGYKGRSGIHEVLLPDDDFRDAILRRSSSRELRQLARTLPAFLTLEESGLLKAMAGQTTLSEIVANAPHSTGTRKPAELREIAGTLRNQGAM
jgi:type IV pilus assembly protein PilB